MRCTISASTALLTGSVPSASISAARSCSCPPGSFKGGETLFNAGKAAREVSHNIVALARCTGSGRGASRRSGQPGFLDRGGVMRRRISRKRRAGSDQELKQPRLPEIGHEGGRRILPQMQVAAIKIFGIDHRAQYMPEHRWRRHAER